MSAPHIASTLSACTEALCAWYAAEKRELPWRVNASAYRVWVSEIMLQQTRVEAVKGYFDRFMTALPTVRDLAEVDPDRLMKLWEGLGYYSRARNLQKAAQILVRDHGGELPADYEKLRALPGIGDYTAGAIASIAFGIAVPAVDGNVLRVLARLTACADDVMRPATRRSLTALCASMVPQEDPASFNQALMELGERVCLPNTMPHCAVCPLRALCAVADTPMAAKLPVRAPKKERRVEPRTVYVLLTQETPSRVVLRKRTDKGLLAGLWELPSTLQSEELAVPIEGVSRVSEWLPLPDSRHLFSHIEWHMKGVLCFVTVSSLPPDCELADAAALAESRALPTAFRAYAHMLPMWLGNEIANGKE